MAKKKDNENMNNDTEEKGSKVGTALFIFLIILVWLAIFALLIKMDVAGMGTKLRPLIKDVPVLNMILPPATDEQLIYEEEYPYANIGEAVEVIKNLEKQVDELSSSNDKYSTNIAELQAEIARLKVYEENEKAFEERVKDFDINVVYNSQAPDIEEYKKYYEEINPETAAQLYQQVIEQLQYDQAIVEKATLLKNMKPGQAAAVMEEMTADIEYTCKLLLAMKPVEATAILDKMDTLFAARLLQKMHDMDDEWYQRIQNNMLQNRDREDTTNEN